MIIITILYIELTRWKKEWQKVLITIYVLIISIIMNYNSSWVLIDNEINKVWLLGNHMICHAKTIEPLYTIIMIILLYYSKNTLINYVYIGGIVVIYSSNLIITWIGLEITALATTAILAKNIKSQGIRYYIMSSVGSIIIIYSILDNYIGIGTFTALEIGIGIIIGLLVKIGIPPLRQWKIDILRMKDIWIGGLLTILIPIPIYWIMRELSVGDMGILPTSLIAQGYQIAIMVSWIVGTILGYIYVKKTDVDLKIEDVLKILGCSSIIQLGWWLFVIPFDIDSIIWMYLYFFNLMIVWILISLYPHGARPEVHSTNELPNLNKYLLNFWLLSLAGFPPTLGFLAKFIVLYNNILVGNLFLSFTSLIVSLFSFFIYFHILSNLNISLLYLSPSSYSKILISSLSSFLIIIAVIL